MNQRKINARHTEPTTQPSILCKQMKKQSEKMDLLNSAEIFNCLIQTETREREHAVCVLFIVSAPTIRFFFLFSYSLFPCCVRLSCIQCAQKNFIVGDHHRRHHHYERSKKISKFFRKLKNRERVVFCLTSKEQTSECTSNWRHSERQRRLTTQKTVCFHSSPYCARDFIWKSGEKSGFNVVVQRRFANNFFG